MVIAMGRATTTRMTIALDGDDDDDEDDDNDYGDDRVAMTTMTTMTTATIGDSNPGGTTTTEYDRKARIREEATNS